jgi:ribosomal protein S12 methylthiotransferase accessory factor YcaO
MPKVRSEIWTNSKGKRFVVLPEEDFARLTELIEDAGLSRIFRRAKATDRGEPGIPYSQVKRQLASHRRRTARN